MKTVTFIVKDSETGSVQKFNAKLDGDKCNVVNGSLNGVMIYARLPISNKKQRAHRCGMLNFQSD